MTTDTPPITPPKSGVRLLIGTPSYDGRVHIDYTLSLLGSLDHLNQRGVVTAVNLLPHRVLPAVRNELALKALEGGFSHLLFADADQAWPAEAVMRLLSWGKDVVGGVVQSRHGGSFAISEARALAVEAPLLEVEAIGTGFLLLSRACLERMMTAHNGHPFQFLYSGDPHPYGFSGEDHAFCRRWRALGGQIYADPSFRMHHFGELAYNMMLHEALEGGRAKIIDGALCFAGDFRPEFTCQRPSA